MIEKRAERTQCTMWWFLLCTMLLCGVVYFTAQYNHASLMVYRRYVPILVWSIMAITLYRGDYKLRSVYSLGLVFLGWYVLTRIMLGDTYLNSSYNSLIEMCASYGLLFPFAMLCKEAERRKAFDIMALIVVFLILFISVFSIICAIKKTTVQTPILGFVFEMRNARLWPLGLNPNVGAPMFNCGMFLLIYLLATYRRKWMIVPGVILVLIIFAACSLTGSRAGIVGRSLGCAVVTCLLVSKICAKKRYLLISLLVISFFAGFFISYKATELSVNIMSDVSDLIYASAEGGSPEAAGLEVDGVEVDAVAVSRNLLTNIGTLGSRAPIYKELMQGIRANPEVLLFGRMESEVMTLLDRYQAWMTLHNSYLQVLALTGVLGLLMILAFSVLVFLAALKLFLAKDRPMGQRVLPIIMVPVVLQGLLESILFVPWTTLGPSAITNFIFMLSAGYTVEMAKGLKFRELLKSEKRPSLHRAAGKEEKEPLHP